VTERYCNRSRHFRRIARYEMAALSFAALLSLVGTDLVEMNGN